MGSHVDAEIGLPCVEDIDVGIIGAPIGGL
jgi:hypothetical protein